jgi:hypothetical protein
MSDALQRRQQQCVGDTSHWSRIVGIGKDGQQRSEKGDASYEKQETRAAADVFD